MNNLYYQVTENDSLAFKPFLNGFELFTKGEATAELKIATFQNSHWHFEDSKQRSMFLLLMQMQPKQFQRAFKAYWKHQDEKPSVWQCGIRKFSIRITKTKRKIGTSISNTFYSAYPSRSFPTYDNNDN